MGEDDTWEYWNAAHHGTLGSCLICVAILCEPLITVRLYCEFGHVHTRSPTSTFATRDLVAKVDVGGLHSLT